MTQAPRDISPSNWAMVIASRAKYLKPFYEGFADAQSSPWRTLLLCPSDSPHYHPPETTTPVHANLSIQEIAGKKHTISVGGNGRSNHYYAQHTWLPGGEMSQTLRQSHVRGVVVHEYSPFCLSALLYGKRKKLPVISFTDVGKQNAQHYSFKTRIWHAFWSQFIDGIMAGCPASRLSISGRHLPMIEAYHAVESSDFTPVPKSSSHPRPITFVYSGQWIQRKGLDLWFAAAKRVKDELGATLRLRLVGGGDEVWTRQMALKYEVADEVEWFGYLQGEAMKKAIGEADVFVLPSRFDSYAVVAHEAACLGLPLLISRHAGAAEAMIKEGVTGWSFAPEDTAEFAQRMAQMLDSTTRTKMGQEARHLGEQLSSPKRGKAVWDWIQQNFL